MFHRYNTLRFTERTGLHVVGIPTIGDGNCLIHAILGAISDVYNRLDYRGKVALATNFRTVWFQHIVAHWDEIDVLAKAAMDTLVTEDSNGNLIPNVTAMLDYRVWLYTGSIEPLLFQDSHIRINWATLQSSRDEQIVFPMATPDSFHRNIYILNTGGHFETLAVYDGVHYHTHVHGNTEVHRALMDNTY